MDRRTCRRGLRRFGIGYLLKADEADANPFSPMDASTTDTSNRPRRTGCASSKGRRRSPSRSGENDYGEVGRAEMEAKRRDTSRLPGRNYRLGRRTRPSWRSLRSSRLTVASNPDSDGCRSGMVMVPDREMFAGWSKSSSRWIVRHPLSDDLKTRCASRGQADRWRQRRWAGYDRRGDDSRTSGGDVWSARERGPASRPISKTSGKVVIPDAGLSSTDEAWHRESPGCRLISDPV